MVETTMSCEDEGIYDTGARVVTEDDGSAREFAL